MGEDSARRRRLVLGRGEGGARRSIKIPQRRSLRRRFLQSLRLLLGRRRERHPRVMATKAVCVLKGDGPVQGTIHFEEKARVGAEADGESVPRTCARERVAGRASGRPRHAPAAPGPPVRAARGLCPAAVLRLRAATRSRPRSAESRGEPGSSTVRGEAAAGLGAGRGAGRAAPRVPTTTGPGGRRESEGGRLAALRASATAAASVGQSGELDAFEKALARFCGVIFWVLRILLLTVAQSNTRPALEIGWRLRRAALSHPLPLEGFISDLSSLVHGFANYGARASSFQDRSLSSPGAKCFLGVCFEYVYV